MGRTSKKSQPKTEDKVQKETAVKTPEVEVPEVEVPVTKETKPEVKKQLEPAKPKQEAPKVVLPEHIKKAMKLNPQYKQMYITPQGFVHPLGSPEYLRKGAKLYTNIYYKY